VCRWSCKTCFEYLDDEYSYYFNSCREGYILVDNECVYQCDLGDSFYSKIYYKKEKK